ncbi:MAG: hypothetical protein AB9869_09430 [Verrucomicrobiia bacterium]
MKVITLLILAGALLAGSAQADLLELKNGNVLNGKYAGGTAGTVQFVTSAGQQVIETSQIVALTFTTPAAPAAEAAPATVPAPVAAAAPSSVSLPSGTVLLVRMMDSVSSKSAPGANFTSKLEYDLVVNGVPAVKAGTLIYGKVAASSQARRAVGRSSLDLRLAQMVVGGKPVPITTSGYKQAGDASVKQAARGAAAGAAIGAIAGDAGAGAAIGATAGALKKGETITIPPGTLLEFTLTQPVAAGISN